MKRLLPTGSFGCSHVLLEVEFGRSPFFGKHDPPRANDCGSFVFQGTSIIEWCSMVQKGVPNKVSLFSKAEVKFSKRYLVLPTHYFRYSVEYLSYIYIYLHIYIPLSRFWVLFWVPILFLVNHWYHGSPFFLHQCADAVLSRSVLAWNWYEQFWIE